MEEKLRIYLTGYIDIPAEKWDEIIAILPEHIALTCAEPGCLKFDVTPCTEVANRLNVSEIFIDKASFDNHGARMKGTAWAKATQGLVRHYEITEGP